MKPNIDKQIARIDQNLKLLIYSQQVRQELNKRKAYLNRCLDYPVKYMSSAECEALVKFVYG